MKFKIGRILLGVLTAGWLSTTQAQFHMSAYEQVMRFVQQRNLPALKSYVAAGNSVDITNVRGDTPLCQAIRQKDYAGFELLVSQGANQQHACVYQISTYDRRAFMQSKPATGTFYTGFYAAAKPANRGAVKTSRSGGDSSGIGSTVLQGVLIAGAVGGIAAAAGGGGGGGGSGGAMNDAHEEVVPDLGDSDYTYDDDNPGFGNGSGNDAGDSGTNDPGNSGGTGSSNTTPTSFETTEYKRGRFLSAINASAAYNRDVSGYVMKDGEVTTQKVKIGIVDTGVAAHSDLEQNVISGFNFDYGPCRGSDSTNCWTFYKNGLSSYATLYDASGNRKVSVSMTQNQWTTFESAYASDYDWDKNQYDVTPLSGKQHGTHVAGIMVASKNGSGMHGVAYNSELIPVRYDFMSGLSEPTVALINAGARVINYSLAIAVTDDTLSAARANERDFVSHKTNFEYLLGEVSLNAYRAAAKTDTVLVFAAGNNGASESSIYAGALLVDEFKDSLKNLLVNVVAIDNTGKLASYSNKCGATSDYCLAAPGGSSSTGIYSTALSGGYGTMSGTSAAAPVVTGSIALLMGAYPHMTSQEVVQLLFETATDLGDKETYGHGLINLDAATKPVGNLNLPSGTFVDQNEVAANRTAITLPASSGEEILAVLPQSVTVLDKYDRAFAMETTNFVRTAHHNPDTFRKALHRFTQHDDVQQVDISPRVSFAFTKSADVKNTSGIGSVDMTYRLSGNQDLHVFFTEDGAYGRAEFFDKALINPFSAMDNAYGFENVYKLSGKTQIKMGFSTGENGMSDGDEERDMLSEKQAFALTGGLDYKVSENSTIGFVGGVLREEKSILGLYGTGGFETPDTNTYYMGITARVKPTEKLTVQAAYYYGLSNPQKGTAFMKTGRLISDSFAVDARYQLNDTDVAGIQFSSPLRIRSGKAEFDLPVGRDLYGNEIYREKVTASLKPSAREYDIAMYYTKTITPALRVKSQAGVRLNPEHMAGAAPDYNMLFSVDWKY